MKKRKIWLVLVTVGILFILYSASLINKQRETKLYQRFIDNLSLVDAKKYLDKFPNGTYKSDIYSLLQKWCESSRQECQPAIEEVFSTEHQLYKEVVEKNSN